MDRNLMNQRIESQMALKAIDSRGLSEYLGITYEAVRRKLTGQNSWKDIELLMLIKLFNCDADYLLKGEE